MPAPDLTEVTSGALLDAVHANVLSLAFPPDELISAAALRESVAGGATSVIAAVDDTGAPVGAAVGDWSDETEVVLLSYLAVRRDGRRGGLGSWLLTHAVAQWRQRWNPCLILAEIEHPAVHRGSEETGDPWARVRFYARHGVRPLAVPYFQPPVHPGGRRVPGLTLAVVYAADAGLGPTPDTVDGQRLTRWLRRYLIGAEGSVGDDAATVAVLAALDRPGGVPLLSYEDVTAVPYSTG